MSHHEQKGHRLYAVLMSGPVVLATAALGVWVGTIWSFGDLPERFQQFYVSIYRMMALPFLALTVVHSIIRLRSDGDDARATGRHIVMYLPMAMVLAASASVAAALAVCLYADSAVSQEIGPLIAAFDKADANYVEVTLAEPETAAVPLLLRVLFDFIPENIFAALAAANVGQMIVFLIIFSVAILKLAPQAAGNFLILVDATRRPLQYLMEKMQVFVPIAVFMYAIHAAHAVSAKDLSSLKLLFFVVSAACLAVFLLAVLVTAILSRRSPLSVARDIKGSAVAGLLAMTEEAALPAMIRRIGAEGRHDDDEREIVASLGLSIGRFGMVVVLASVLTFTIALYDIPPSVTTLGSIVVLSGIAAVLISSLNGPGVFAAALAFCGLELGLPVEALVVLVIVMEPLLEILLIPVSVAVTHALVEVVSLLHGTRNGQSMSATTIPSTET